MTSEPQKGARPDVANALVAIWLGRHRWKAERSIAWLAGCRRLRIRYDRSSER
jgi:hypothetical protein